MRKLSLIAIVVLVIGVLGLPAVFGRLTESQVEARVAAINEGEVLDVSVDEYSRGWFASTARLSLRLAPQYVQNLTATMPEPPPWLASGRALPVVAELGHGPVGFVQGPFVGLSKLVARADPRTPWVRDVTETYAMPYLFEFRGRTGYTGRVSFDADVPPIDTAATGGGTRFSGATLEGTLAGNRLAAAARVDELDVTAPGVSLLISGVQATTDSRFVAPYRTTGTFALDAEEVGFALQAPEPRTLQMTGTRLASDSAVEDGAWRTRIDYTADSITTPNGQQIEQTALGLGLDGFDAAAIDELQALVQQRAADPAGAPDLAFPDVVPLLNRLLAGRPSLEITPIRFTTDGDAFDASVRLEIREDATPDVAELISAPGAWLGAVNGAVDATIAKPLARRIAVQAARAQLAAQAEQPANQDPAQLAESQAALVLVMLTGQGYVEETEDAYSTELRLADGTITINGQPLPQLGMP